MFGLAIIVAFGVSLTESADCYWTGCQPDTWMIRGCNLFKQTEMKLCNGIRGAKYHCCDWGAERAASPRDFLKECKWTSCKSKSSNRTCEVDQLQIASAPCDNWGGFKYQCCPIRPVPPQLLNGKCWWSGCQLKTWLARGCPATTVIAGKMNCSAGDQYKCCIPGIRVPVQKPTDIPKDKERCSPTECQPKSQPVRGCPSNSTEKGRDGCVNGGLTFKCCIHAAGGVGHSSFYKSANTSLLGHRRQSG